MTYQQKLKDPRWQKKRLEVLQRDNFTCKLCGDNTITLHVHHTVYSGNPWDVAIENLHTLCEHCHMFVEMHKNQQHEIYGIVKWDYETEVVLFGKMKDHFLMCFIISGRIYTSSLRVNYEDITNLLPELYEKK